MLCNNLNINKIRLVLTLLGYTPLSADAVRPHAGSRVLVEVESSSTLDLNGFTLDTVVKDVTDGGVGVSEEAVTARAQVVRFCEF